MGKFIVPSGAHTAIAICDRCKMKMPYDALMADGNSPGLRVCKDCWDTKDPWRLSPRKTEDISLRFPRPDVDVSVTN